MAGIAAPNIVKDGLVFSVDPMNPRSWTGPDSSTVNDLKGGITGSIYNDTSGSYGDNNSFNFDGTDDYIDCGNIFSAFDNSTQISLSVWIKPSNFYFRAILSIANGTGNNANVIRLRIRDTGVLQWTLGSDSYYAVQTSADLNLNQWNHVVAIFDTSQALTSNRAKIFVNNIKSSVSINMPINRTGGTAISGVFIGENASNLSHLFSFFGDMSGIMMYNRALSPQEVKQNYNALKGRFGL